MKSDTVPLKERLPDADKKKDTTLSGRCPPAGEIVGEYKLCEREPPNSSGVTDHLYDVVTSDTVSIQPAEAKPPTKVAATSDLNPASPLRLAAVSLEKRHSTVQTNAPGEHPTGTEVAQGNPKDDTLYDRIANDPAPQQQVTPAPQPQVAPAPQLQVSLTTPQQVGPASLPQVSPTLQLLAEYAVVSKPRVEPAPPVPPFTTESSILTVTDEAIGQRAAEQGGMEPGKAARHHSYINVENKPILEGEYDVIV